MFREYVERGLLAGGAGGLAFGLFVAAVGNPLIRAIEGLGRGHHDGHEAAVVSETAANIVSVGGGVLWGMVLGAAAFGVAYYFLEPAIPGAGATKRYVLAGGGFLTVSGAPWLVVPPQPPGVETTLGLRSAMLAYGGMALLGAAACALAGVLYNRLRSRGRGPAAATAAGLAPLAVLAVPALLGSASATGDLSASMVAAYRGVTVFGQVMLWVVLASTHAWLGDDRSGVRTGVDTVTESPRPSD